MNDWMILTLVRVERYRALVRGKVDGEHHLEMYFWENAPTPLQETPQPT
jgi:hypothetical protein